jgi:hypothetical protein
LGRKKTVKQAGPLSDSSFLVKASGLRGRNMKREARVRGTRVEICGAQTGLGYEVRPMMVADLGCGPHRLAEKRREGPGAVCFFFLLLLLLSGKGQG